MGKPITDDVSDLLNSSYKKLIEKRADIKRNYLSELNQSVKQEVVKSAEYARFKKALNILLDKGYSLYDISKALGVSWHTLKRMAE